METGPGPFLFTEMSPETIASASLGQALGNTEPAAKRTGVWEHRGFFWGVVETRGCCVSIFFEVSIFLRKKTVHIVVHCGRNWGW